MLLLIENSPNFFDSDAPTFINQLQWTKFESNMSHAASNLWWTSSRTTRNHLCFQIQNVFVVAHVNRKPKYIDFRPSGLHMEYRMKTPVN